MATLTDTLSFSHSDLIKTSAIISTIHTEVVDEVHQEAASESSSEKLLKLLTLEEKVQLLSGANFVATSAIERLSIPSLKVVDTINGVKGSDFSHGTSTLCFPSTTCLGATWNRSLLSRMGTSLAKQAKSKSAQVLLGPAINLQRDPRGGRNFESFGEDPLHIGELGAALVNSIQAEGVAVCPKHLVGNECETKRRTQDVVESLDGRAMREIYLSTFQVLLRNSKPMAIMTAYNKVDGTFCSENKHLIQEILREQWGYEGCVMSDWYGTHSDISALDAGLDLEMPGPTVFRGTPLINKILSGEVPGSLIDERVKNYLRMIELTARSHSSEPERSLDDKDGNLLAREIGHEGIVLLQNRKSVLPIRKTQKIVIVGSAAKSPPISGGGSAAAPPQYLQEPLDSIRSLHADPASVRWAEGVKSHRTVPLIPLDQIYARNGEHGVDVQYYNDGISNPIIEDFQHQPNLAMLGHIKPGLNNGAFRFEMSTTLVPITSGTHTLAVQATGDFTLKVNNKVVLQKQMENVTVEDFLFMPQNLETTAQIIMRANVPYHIHLTVQPHKPTVATGEPLVHSVKLGYIEEFSDEESIEEAAALASTADTTIIFAGRTPEYESEGFDMESLALPPNQVKMIKAVAAASRRSVLIINCGNPVDVQDFVDDVDAIVLAHFLGQEGGNALADILYGEVCPSGRLAVTWPKRLEDVPSFDHFPAKQTERGWEVGCGEGINIGYRSRNVKILPQWAFGFGLSYTSFRLADLKVLKLSNDDLVSENEIKVEVLLENVGTIRGAEVVQMYIEDVECSVPRPAKELKAFEKIMLEPGMSEIVELKVKQKHAFGFWDEEKKAWSVEAGVFRIHVGELSADVVVDEGYTWVGL